MCYYGCIKDILEDVFFDSSSGLYVSNCDSQCGKPPRDLRFVLLCRIVQGNYLRLRRMNDPEKYQRDNFNRLQHSIRARWHGKDKVLDLLYYKTHRVQKGGALFGKLPTELRCLLG